MNAINTITNIGKNINYLKIKKPNVWFEDGVILSKVIIMGLLLILAFINADISFIIDNPRNFLTESLLTGIMASIPTILIAYNRGSKKDDIISAIFITFFIFFLFNTLMEFSGLNGYLNGYKSTDIQQKERISKIENNWWIWMILVTISLIMIYLAIITHDFPKKMGWSVLLTELTVFSILNTIPQVFIAYNRGSNIVIPTFVSLTFYIAVYVIFQSGGFFSHIFGDEFNNIYTTEKSSSESDNLDTSSTNSTSSTSSINSKSSKDSINNNELNNRYEKTRYNRE
jgi:hypothetical protein